MTLTGNQTRAAPCEGALDRHLPDCVTSWRIPCPTTLHEDSVVRASYACLLRLSIGPSYSVRSSTSTGLPGAYGPKADSALSQVSGQGTRGSQLRMESCWSGQRDEAARKMFAHIRRAFAGHLPRRCTGDFRIPQRMPCGGRVRIAARESLAARRADAVAGAGQAGAYRKPRRCLGEVGLALAQTCDERIPAARHSSVRARSSKFVERASRIGIRRGGATQTPIHEASSWLE